MKQIKTPKLLVSVKNFNEIYKVKNYADIIDLKNPEDGPLGSWSRKNIIIAVKNKRNKFSATLGNEKKKSDILKKLLIFDDLRLNYIKVGFFHDEVSDIFDLLQRLEIKIFKTKLVGVLFAEKKNILDFAFKNIKYFVKAGFKFLLIDTCKKESLDLLSIHSTSYLVNCISVCKKNNIEIGVAGKLKLQQIPILIKLKPDLIGVRSAVCMGLNRKNNISEKLTKELKSYFISEIKSAQAVAGA